MSETQKRLLTWLANQYSEADTDILAALNERPRDNEAEWRWQYWLPEIAVELWEALPMEAKLLSWAFATDRREDYKIGLDRDY